MMKTKTFMIVVTLSVLFALTNADSKWSDPTSDMGLPPSKDRELQTAMAQEEMDCYDRMRVVKMLATECSRDDDAGTYTLEVLFD